MSKPLLFFTTVVSQTFFIIIIIMIIVYIFSIKSMLDFVLFLKKKKLKYFSKNTVLNMANKTFRKPHISTKDATGMCLYTTHKGYNSEMQKSLSH